VSVVGLFTPLFNEKNPPKNLLKNRVFKNQVFKTPPIFGGFGFLADETKVVKNPPIEIRNVTHNLDWMEDLESVLNEILFYVLDDPID